MDTEKLQHKQDQYLELLIDNAVKTKIKQEIDNLRRESPIFKLYFLDHLA